MLGANDGIVSVAAMVVGVAGATSSVPALVAAGVASQSDSRNVLIAKERRELAETPEAELAGLVGLYRAKGLSPDVVSAFHAAWVSATAFTLGALLPLLAILLPPASIRVPVTFGAVFVALVVLGMTGARLGGSQLLRLV